MLKSRNLLAVDIPAIESTQTPLNGVFHGRLLTPYILCQTRRSPFLLLLLLLLLVLVHVSHDVAEYTRDLYLWSSELSVFENSRTCCYTLIVFISFFRSFSSMTHLDLYNRMHTTRFKRDIDLVILLFWDCLYFIFYIIYISDIL